MNFNRLCKSDGFSVLRRCLCSALLFGLAAHAAGMFAGISYHDDVVCTYDVGTTHIVGRFTLALLGKITRLPFGGSNYSLPWLNGLVSILLIGLGGWVMSRSLCLTSRLLQVLLCGILVTFPVVTGTFAYWFTAPYYMLALLLACISAVLLAGSSACPFGFRASDSDLFRFRTFDSDLFGFRASCLRSLCRRQSPSENSRMRAAGRWLLGIVLAALMIGIYQAYLPVMLTLEVLLLLQKESEGSGSWRGWLRPLLGTGAALFLYLILMKASLSLTGKELYAYRGVDTMGAGSFSYPARIAMAYRVFFRQDAFLSYRGSDDYQLFMWSMSTVYCVLIALLVLMGTVLVLHRSRGLAGGRLRMLLLMLLFPLTVNFVFVMTDFDVYDLMLYGQVMIFVMGLWLAQQLARSGLQRVRAQMVTFGLAGALCLLVLYSVLFYIRYDNLCYYKAGRMQEAAVSYDNVLIARIQSLEGYDPALPVCFLNEFEKDTSYIAADPELETVRITPYDGSEIINDYSWVSFMRVHCGYDPQVIEDYGQYEDYVDRTQMPRYPAKDSIRIVDGVIVVNF